MSHDIDLSNANLIARPEAMRDGGSICLTLRTSKGDYNLRYAGSFGDVLKDRDGMLEFSDFGKHHSGLWFIDPDDVPGLTEFVSRYQDELGRFAEIFLGRERRTKLQISEIRAQFDRKPEV